ncbi:MAG: hypothetical protein C4576_03740 [Desulfobacteraceae bacterium]|nr:MAG: hypothetical protein C4576_03740 [Desulfobacteraceae bacterium]
MMIKALPGVESMIGSVHVPAFSGATSYAAGVVFIGHFETGGDVPVKPSTCCREVSALMNLRKRSPLHDAKKGGNSGGR